MCEGGGNLRSEETGQQVSNDTTDGVLSEDIEGVINADPELDLRGQIAADATNDAEDDRCPRGNETGSRCDGNETLKQSS